MEYMGQDRAEPKKFGKLKEKNAEKQEILEKPFYFASFFISYYYPLKQLLCKRFLQHTNCRIRDGNTNKMKISIDRGILSCALLSGRCKEKY